MGLGVGAGGLGGGGDVGFAFYFLTIFFSPRESVVIAPRYSPRHFRWDELDPPGVKEETDLPSGFSILPSWARKDPSPQRSRCPAGMSPMMTRTRTGWSGSCLSGATSTGTTRTRTALCPAPGWALPLWVRGCGRAAEGPRFLNKVRGGCVHPFCVRLKYKEKG